MSYSNCELALSLCRNKKMEHTVCNMPVRDDSTTEARDGNTSPVACLISFWSFTGQH